MWGENKKNLSVFGVNKNGRHFVDNQMHKITAVTVALAGNRLSIFSPVGYSYTLNDCFWFDCPSVSTEAWPSATKNLQILSRHLSWCLKIIIAK